MKTVHRKYFAVFMLINLVFEVVSPSVAFALTNGPVQPEVLGFQNATNSETVDPFTGDFRYNIPLLDVDGYPVNISYQAGPQMESEASWVGLGWSLCPGVINRSMRGLPDDFDGEQVVTETNVRDNMTSGSGVQLRLLGGLSAGYGDILNLGAGLTANFTAGAMINYNNYTGHSLELQLDHSIGFGAGVGVLFFSPLAGSISYGQGVRVSTAEGVTTSSYRALGYSILNGAHPVPEISSAQFVNGSSANSRTGMTYDLYSRSHASATILDAIVPNFLEQSESRTAQVPTSPIAFPPRVNNSFRGNSYSRSDLRGLYGCSPLGFIPVTVEMSALFGKTKYESSVVLEDRNKSTRAYGYMNLENADDGSLMDFNRFKDGVFMSEAPNGPYATLTNDMFSSCAQGLSTNFRAHRSDYGTVHDPRAGTKSTGQTEHQGRGYNMIYFSEDASGQRLSVSSDGDWSTSPMANSLKFSGARLTENAERYNEKYYFKQMGEPTPVDVAYESMGGGQSAVKPNLTSLAGECVALSPIPGGKKSSRSVRTVHYKQLNGFEASVRALDRPVRSFSRNVFTLNAASRSPMSSNSQLRSQLHGLSTGHHLSEITVTKDDGTRYVYGIPVYNKMSKSVTFNASDYTVNGVLAAPSQNDLPKSEKLRMIKYNSADASSSNDRGIDNYFHSVETPGYAQSFLLSGIISTDYVDLTGDGLTHDDLGTYLKFNYSNTNEYGWRSPSNVPSGQVDEEGLGGGGSHAMLDQGLKSEDLDDKAMFEYGKRENWYLHSIESKNYIAEFETGNRDDNCGVLDEEGDLANNSSFCLKQIRLYAKSEKIRAASVGTAAIPIKTVSFEYDYSLCKNVFNQANFGQGKLTLRKVYFTYGESNRSALSPYKFSYGDSDHDGTQEANPDYDPRAVDRWGNYKPNNGAINNTDFWYSEQDEVKADRYAAAWNLTSIETPTGAKTDIYYETDRYSYVQDEPAATMLQVSGFFSSINKTPNFDYSTVPSQQDIRYGMEMLVDLRRLNIGISTALPKSAADQVVSKDMFPKTKKLYLRCKTLMAYNQMYDNLINKDYWEYVPCYANVQASGVVDKNGTDNTYTTTQGTFYKYAWVRLRGEEVTETSGALVNPVTRAGWEMVRTYMPKIAYPGSQPNASLLSSDPATTANTLMASLGVALQDHTLGMFKAQNLRMLNRGYCKQIDAADSWVRAYSPYKTKLGGGHRVKKMVTSDNWSASVNAESSSTYGQVFDYTVVENGKQLSSGVASYEPLLGGDENSMHQPYQYTFEKNFAPNDHYFQESPYLEYLYPAAMVGYSKVSIKGLDHEYGSGSSLKKVKPLGRLDMEFYTARDFPVIERRTPFTKMSTNNEPIDAYTISLLLYNFQAGSQGFLVKLNDMHGKLKSSKVFTGDNPQAPFAGETYYYKSIPANAKGGRELVQEVPTLGENMQIGYKTVCRNIDVTSDLRRASSINITTGVTEYYKESVCNPFGRGTEDHESGVDVLGMGTASITKVIQQFGILDRVESFQDRSNTTAQNLLWDVNTGEVLLSVINDNLNQPQYTFNQPAFWGYKDLGPRFRRQGLCYALPPSISGWTPATGNIQASLINGFFKPGDEVFIRQKTMLGQIGNRYWIIENPTSPNQWMFVDVNGIPMTGSTPGVGIDTLLIQIDRPAERNLQSLKMANVTTLKNPIYNLPPGSYMSVPTQSIISASAVEYCQLWDYFKHFTTFPMQQSGAALPPYFEPTQMASPLNPLVNPYSVNMKGCWRPWKTYVYNDRRYYDNGQPDKRTDGLYSTFVPFWNPSAGNWSKVNPGQPNADKWVVQSENSIYSPYGYLMESKDALGRPSSSRMGFNHTLPVLQASNATVREVGFDSFEEYENYYPSFGNSLSTQIITNDQLGFYRQLNSSVFPSSTAPSATSADAHTGRFSIEFAKGQTITLSHDLLSYPPVEPPPVPQRCDFSGLVNLDFLRFNSNVTYLVSFWAKSKVVASDYQGVFTFGIQATQPANGGVFAGTILSSQRTNVINGWQKFDYEVRFPGLTYNPANRAQIVLSAPSTSAGFYIDDFRVQPSAATMNCVVYDPYTLKTWATLDDRNFATYLEYDREGNLVRTKKETVNGVFTLNESRKGIKK